MKKTLVILGLLGMIGCAKKPNDEPSIMHPVSSMAQIHDDISATREQVLVLSANFNKCNDAVVDYQEMVRDLIAMHDPAINKILLRHVKRQERIFSNSEAK